jgi:hypothetical protein
MRKRRPTKLDFSTRGGHRLLLDDTTGHIELRHANGPVVSIEPSGSISINAISRIELVARLSASMLRSQRLMEYSNARRS